MSGRRPRVVDLVHPGLDDVRHPGGWHRRERQVVARRETDDTTDAGFMLDDQQPGFVGTAGWRVGAQRCEVVVEHEGGLVRRVPGAAGPRVPGAEIAGRVEPRRPGLDRPLYPALPRAIGPMRRHEHPLPQQRVEAPVRSIEECHRGEARGRRAVTAAPLSIPGRSDPASDQFRSSDSGPQPPSRTALRLAAIQPAR